MKKSVIALSAIIACLSVFSAGCEKTEKPEPADDDPKPYFYSMDTEAQMGIPTSAQKGREEECKDLYRATYNILSSIEGSISATYKESYISKFNAAEAGAKVEIDKTTHEVLSLALSVYNLTGGNYNPSVYYSVRAYGFFGLVIPGEERTADMLPAAENIAKFNSLSSHFGELELTEENGKYYAVKPAATAEIGGVTYSMSVDLGGIGKGYAVDKIYALMKEKNFGRGYFSFGTSSMVCRQFDENGNGYKLAFANPRQSRESSATYVKTDICDECVSTSGDYEKYYTVDGARYCHIIDPNTGIPVQSGIMTATVIGGSAAEADALTTALMAMGREKAIEFINENLTGRRVIFTYDDNGKYLVYTNMPEGSYTIDDNAYTLASRAEDGKILPKE